MVAGHVGWNPASQQAVFALGKEKDLITLCWHSGDALQFNPGTHKPDGFILVFDVCERTSFYELSAFKDKILRYDPKAILSLVQSVDRVSEEGREKMVTDERARKLADEFGCPLHLEASFFGADGSSSLWSNTPTPKLDEVVTVLVSRIAEQRARDSKWNAFRRLITSVFDPEEKKKDAEAHPINSPMVPATTATTITTSASNPSSRNTSATSSTIAACLFAPEQEDVQFEFVGPVATIFPSKSPARPKDVEGDLRRTQESLYDARDEIARLTQVIATLRYENRNLKSYNQTLVDTLLLYDLEVPPAPTVTSTKPVRYSSSIYSSSSSTSTTTTSSKAAGKLSEETVTQPSGSFDRSRYLAKFAMDRWKTTVRARASEREIQRLLQEDQQLKEKELNAKSYMCSICSDEYPIEDIYVLDDCFHRFCFACLAAYVKTSILDGNCNRMKCPELDCEKLLHPGEIRHLVDPELFAKFETFSLKHALDNMADLLWCPKPGCGNAMIGDEGEAMVRCSNQECQFTFCSVCKEEWHPDISCEKWREWKLENNENESRTQAWIKKNAKNCPQCKASIEKNGGCNHITCKACDYEFCWLCLKKYTSNHFGERLWSCKQFS